jgi:dCTP deaminase
VGCAGLVPWLDGRSSVGRLGISVHSTAGRGDDGFFGRWTLEVSVVHPVRVYPGMKVGQVTFFDLRGERRPYRGKYQNQDAAVASKLWEDAPCAGSDSTASGGRPATGTG